jgi:hypothetical protein
MMITERWMEPDFCLQVAAQHQNQLRLARMTGDEVAVLSLCFVVPEGEFRVEMGFENDGAVGSPIELNSGCHAVTPETRVLGSPMTRCMRR